MDSSGWASDTGNCRAATLRKRPVNPDKTTTKNIRDGVFYEHFSWRWLVGWLRPLFPDWSIVPIVFLLSIRTRFSSTFWRIRLALCRRWATTCGKQHCIIAKFDIFCGYAINPYDAKQNLDIFYFISPIKMEIFIILDFLTEELNFQQQPLKLPFVESFLQSWARDNFLASRQRQCDIMTM